MQTLRSTSLSVVRFFATAIALLIGVSVTTSAVAEPDFPTLSGRVVDVAGLLTPEQVTALTTQLAKHETETSNQVVVATVKDLQGYSIADYANRLGRHWGIGQQDKDNGVVLLVAPNEREVRIEVGYGLEGALTDATSSDIIRRQILPSFREDDYARGIQRGVENILAAIKGEYTVEPRSPGNEQKAYGSLPVFAVVLLMQAFMVLGNRKIQHSVFPAGFAGILVMAITKNMVAGLVVALAVFGVIYFIVKPTGGSGGGGTGGVGSNDRRGHHTRQSRGGGGFGGGGGSFGGGGASGSW